MNNIQQQKEVNPYEASEGFKKFTIIFLIIALSGVWIIPLRILMALYYYLMCGNWIVVINKCIDI